MRLLHCADVHLDTTFQGLGPVAARRRRQAILQAFSRIVDLAKEERVDCLTIAGDLYEDLRIRPDTVSFLQQQLARLDCPVLISPGNHDYWHPGSVYARTQWPANVHIFSASEFTPFEVDGWRIFGIGHQQPKGTQNLLSGFAVPEGPHALALFHGSERGQLSFQGDQKEDHAPFVEEEISECGFEYALLGHFHTPRSTPHLLYPGNPEPLTFGEAGARGPVLVDFSSLPPTTEVRSVAVFEALDLEVDISSCSNSEAVAEEVEERLPEERNSASRVRLVGELQPGVHLSVPTLLERLRGEDRCLDLQVAARLGLDLDSLRESGDARGQFVRALSGRPDFGTELVQMALRAGLDALRGEEPALL